MNISKEELQKVQALPQRDKIKTLVQLLDDNFFKVDDENYREFMLTFKDELRVIQSTNKTWKYNGKVSTVNLPLEEVYDVWQEGLTDEVMKHYDN